MAQFNIHDPKPNLSRLIDMVERGEEVIICKHGKPVARILPFQEPRPLRGSILREEDLVSPLDDRWDADA